jgi:hypothetical protein
VFSFLTLNNTLALSDNRINMVRNCVYTHKLQGDGSKVILNSSALQQTALSDEAQ